MKYELLLPALLLVVVVILLAIGFVLFLRKRRIIRHWHQTSGLVIGEELVDADDNGTFSAPVIRFTALDGREIRFVEKYSNSPLEYKLGQQFKVYYNPRNFHQARVFTTTYRMYYWAVFFLGLGAVFSLTGALVAITYVIVSNLSIEP